MTSQDTSGGDAGAPREKRTNPKTAFIIAWTKQVSRDGRLLPGSHRLAPRIAQNLWPHEEHVDRYVLTKDQKFFRDDLEVSRTSIQNWLNDLVRHGHLEVVVRKGQGKMNEYLPVLGLMPRSAADPAPKAERIRATPKGETMPPVDTDVAKPADPLHLPDDGETAILREMPMAEVGAIVARLDDDIAWLRANESVHQPEPNSPEYPAFVAHCDEIQARENRFGELVAVLRAAFPSRPGPDLSKGIQDFLVSLVLRGDDPMEIIREAREYVRATEAAGERPKGPFKWIHERIMADSQARRARVAAGS